jgi:hypothetical protein
VDVVFEEQRFPSPSRATPVGSQHGVNSAEIVLQVLQVFPRRCSHADHRWCQRDVEWGWPMTKKSKAGADFANVAYKVRDSGTTVMPWSDADADAIAEGVPWRRFSSYLGQRNYPGLYWCATEANLVGYESLLERSRLLFADFDRSSKRVASQPFQITARVDGEQLERVPDYLVLTDTGPLVIDVTRRERLERPKYRHIFDLTRQVVESRGWQYELAHEPPRIEHTNIRFLSGYRRPWLFDEKILAEIQLRAESESEPSVSGIAAGTSYPKHTALPALMHLLWRQDHLRVDVSKRLSPATRVLVAA